MNFTGLSAFPITPALPDGSLCTDLFENLIDRLAAAGVDSITILGSTGVAPYLSRRTRREVVETAVGAAAGIPVMAGIGALRTDEVCLLAEDAARAGASALLLAPISYLPLTMEEVFGLFAAAARTTDLPICIYSNPATTRFHFDDLLLARLAELPTVRAAKLPLPVDRAVEEELQSLRAATALHIGYSGDWGCAEALLRGADCWYSIGGALFPRVARSLVVAAKSGNEVETRRINELFAPLWSLFREHGSVRVAYAVAAQLGLREVHPPLPLRRLDQAFWPALRSAIGPLR